MCHPKSIKNSERSPPTPYVAMDDIERSKNLGPGVSGSVGGGVNINFHTLPPVSHMRSCTIQRTSPVKITVMEGFTNLHIKSRFPEICSILIKSLPTKTTNSRHTNGIPVCIVEKMVDSREPDAL